MESIETINQRLLDTWGRFETTNNPNFRVVWSTDQREKIWSDVTIEGFQLQVEEVMELPKYSYKKDKYVLERCLPVPPFVETKLVEPYSYEPIWFFEDKDGFPLPPKWEAIEVILYFLHKAASEAIGKKYPNPYEGLTTDELKEYESQRLKKIQEDLFGNETDVTDALHHKEGIVVP